MPAGGDQSSQVDLSHAPRRARFAIAYARNGGNGRQAVIEAGYSEKFADQYASRMLKDAKVRAAIERQQKAMCTVAGETEDTILQRDIVWANADIADYFVNGNQHQGLKPFCELTRDQRSCIKKFTTTQHGYNFELHDATAANRRLAEYNGMVKREQEPISAQEAANLIAAALADIENLDGPDAKPNVH